MSFNIKFEDFVKTYSEKYHSAVSYPKILEEYKLNKDISRISQLFKIPYQTLWKWVNHKTIPVPFAEYSKIKKEFSEDDINNLAIVVGYIFGDGGILNNGRVHYCNTEKFLTDEFISSMNKVFSAKPFVREEADITRVKYSALIGRSIWCIFGKFSFGTDTKIITPQIKNMPLSWKSNMLQSFFNDDGSVPKYGVVSIKQKLKPLIVFIKETLLELGIKSIIIEDKGQWLLRVCGYKNLLMFRDKVNFSEGYRKRQQLDDLIRSIKKPHFVMKDKILELLKEVPRTRKELSELLNMNPAVVYGHLHGWKRKTRKSNLGLVDLGLARAEKVGRMNVYSATGA